MKLKGGWSSSFRRENFRDPFGIIGEAESKAGLSEGRHLPPSLTTLFWSQGPNGRGELPASCSPTTHTHDNTSILINKHTHNKFIFFLNRKFFFAPTYSLSLHFLTEFTGGKQYREKGKQGSARKGDWKETISWLWEAKCYQGGCD